MLLNNDVKKQFGHLIAGKENKNNKTIYYLIVINNSDIQLLHSTIQNIKSISPNCLMNIAINDSILSDTVIDYLCGQNFDMIDSYSRDFGFGGKNNVYWNYNNFSCQAFS